MICALWMWYIMRRQMHSSIEKQIVYLWQSCSLLWPERVLCEPLGWIWTHLLYILTRVRKWLKFSLENLSLKCVKMLDGIAESFVYICKLISFTPPLFGDYNMWNFCWVKLGFLQRLVKTTSYCICWRIIYLEFFSARQMLILEWA